jgi:LemA protein
VESFCSLPNSLGQIEEALQNARRYYNAVVRDLNTAIASFPSNLVAMLFVVQPRPFFMLGSISKAEVPRLPFDT